MACRDHSRSNRRCGSFLIEAVVSLALLATAFVAVSRLASSASALGKHADHRVAATLAGQNVIERFRSLPPSQWEQRRVSVIDEVRDLTGCELDVEVEPIDQPSGFHLRVTVRVRDKVQLTFHDWRLAESASDADEDEVTDQEATNQAANAEASE